jgi:hypothetical protein
MKSYRVLQIMHDFVCNKWIIGIKYIPFAFKVLLEVGVPQ